MIISALPTPTVLIVHNALPHERHVFDGRFTKAVLSRAVAAVAHSNSVAQNLHQMVPHLPVIVLPHPPNIDVTPSRMPTRPPLACLFLGMVRRYKGLDLAIEAIGLARRSGLDLMLTVAGEFWGSRSIYDRLIARWKLEDHVEIEAGYVPDDRVGHLLSSHHVLLAPYRSASQSGLVPIAHAAGRPAVVTDVGGLSESVMHGVNGLVVSRADANEIAVALRVADQRLDVLAAGALDSVPATWSDLADAVLRIGSKPRGTA